MEQLNRFILQTNEKTIEKIKNTTIAVIGLGGVGSYTVESLARSGIGKLIIVDSDTIDITNLNRQLMSLHSNIGKYKTDVWEERIKDINPNCQIKKITDFITKENISQIFVENIDYLVDACDTVSTKMELIKECSKRNIKIISSMGVGNRLNCNKLQLMDIRKTSYDPLAKKLRKMVKDERIKNKVMTVCSLEQPIKIESSVISSNSFVPASAGLLITNYIINDIIKEVNNENK